MVTKAAPSVVIDALAQHAPAVGAKDEEREVTRSLFGRMSEIYVPHPKIERVLTNSRLAIERQHGQSDEAPCLLIGGPSGAGKTTLIRKLQALYPVVVDGVAATHPLLGAMTLDHRPLLIVEMPDAPTPISVGQAMLKAFGCPNYYRGGKTNVGHRVDMLITECRTKAIVLDEAQRAVDRNGTVVSFALVDWIKSRHGATGVLVILVGLGRTRLLFEQDDQFDRRWDVEIRLEPYRWVDEAGNDLPDEQADFIAVIDAFQRLAPLPFAIRLLVFGDDEMLAELAARRFFYASQGVVGLLVKLLRKASRLMMEAPSIYTEFSLALLHEAFEKGFNYRRKGMVNPFSSDWVAMLPPPLIDDTAEVSSLVKRTRKPTKRQRRQEALATFTKR